MEKIKFVMTDTDTQVSDACRRALEGKGVSVTVCEKNGTKALDALLAIHPQAVLLDAFMPDLDAITVKQRYEAQNAGGSRTTFFVTGAFQSEEIEQELLDSGFSFFFVKPFDENVLVSRVLKAAGNTIRPQIVSQDSDELRRAACCAADSRDLRQRYFRLRCRQRSFPGQTERLRL